MWSKRPRRRCCTGTPTLRCWKSSGQVAAARRTRGQPGCLRLRRRRPRRRSHHRRRSHLRLFLSRRHCLLGSPDLVLRFRRRTSRRGRRCCRGRRRRPSRAWVTGRCGRGACACVWRRGSWHRGPWRRSPSISWPGPTRRRSGPEPCTARSSSSLNLSVTIHTLQLFLSLSSSTLLFFVPNFLSSAFPLSLSAGTIWLNGREKEEKRKEIASCCDIYKKILILCL